MKQKVSILTLFTGLLLASIFTNGQSRKLLQEYGHKPINDTAYLYTQKRFTNSDGKVFLWQIDLQTQLRYEVDVNCLPEESIPAVGSIVRTYRSKMIINSKNKKHEN